MVSEHAYGSYFLPLELPEGLGKWEEEEYEIIILDFKIYMMMSFFKVYVNCDSISVTAMSFLVSLNIMFAFCILPLENYM